MTCFWDSILSRLSIEDFKLLGHNKKLGREEFIKALKNKNCMVKTKWLGNELREQEKKSILKQLNVTILKVYIMDI